MEGKSGQIADERHVNCCSKDECRDVPCMWHLSLALFSSVCLQLWVCFSLLVLVSSLFAGSISRCEVKSSKKLRKSNKYLFNELRNKTSVCHSKSDKNF